MFDRTDDKELSSSVSAALDLLAATSGADGVALLSATDEVGELRVIESAPAGLDKRGFQVSRKLLQSVGKGAVPGSDVVLPTAFTRWLRFVANRVCLHRMHTEGADIYLLLCWRETESADGLPILITQASRLLPPLVDHHALLARQQILVSQLDAMMNKVELGMVFTGSTGASTVNPRAAALLGVQTGNVAAAEVAAAMERMRGTCEIERDDARFAVGGQSAELWLLPRREKVYSVESHMVGDRAYSGRFWVFSDVTDMWQAAEQLQSKNALLTSEVTRRIAVEEELRRYTEDLQISHSFMEKRAAESTELAEMLAEQKQALELSKQDSDFLATHDALTGLFNRRGFNEQVKRMIAAADASHGQVALMFIDLDKFKLVNDTLGHDAGDHVLREISDALTRTVREGDVVARLGGDEFAIVTVKPRSSPASSLLQLAERLRQASILNVTAPNAIITVGATIGFACYPGDAEDFDQLTAFADQAMYEGKRRGRNLAVAYADLPRKG